MITHPLEAAASAAENAKRNFAASRAQSPHRDRERKPVELRQPEALSDAALPLGGSPVRMPKVGHSACPQNRKKKSEISFGLSKVLLMRDMRKQPI